ncbi:MAG: hypothetical protein IJL69_02965 [Oscillospiraceae bacterium]|nr:hypothetical protein [Oscillospiraceae bacterium]
MRADHRRALQSEQTVTAEELKAEGIGTYLAEKDGKQFLIMVDPDSGYGDFGEGYGVILSPVQ